jgi:hypothetical protein
LKRNGRSLNLSAASICSVATPMTVARAQRPVLLPSPIRRSTKVPRDPL